MKDYRFLIENTLENMDLKISDFWLFEGITEFAKQFPKMPEEKLRKFLALDPTYKGGEQVGKYGNWIIRLFYNNLKNSEMMQQYKDFYTKNNGINPKTGKVIEKPELLPATPWEDADKLPNLLKQYDMLKNKIKKPITDFKSIPELYQAIDAITNEGVPQDKKAMERYYIFKNAEKKGLKIIYNDKDWIIGIPETFESSKMFGDVTNWCTTSHNGMYYDRYLNQYGGQYYILLDKETGELFQFHFESNQFMNEHDHQIDMYNFTEEEPKICEFLNEYKNKLVKTKSEEEIEYDKITQLLNSFNEICSDPKRINRQILYENYTDDIKIEGDKITGQFDLDSLKSIVYSEDDMSLKTMCGLLTDFYSHYDFGDYSLDDYNYYDDVWNDNAELYNIEEQYNWDKICKIYYDGFTKIVKDLEEKIDDNILYQLVKNNYADTKVHAKAKLLLDGVIDVNNNIIDSEKLEKILPENWNEDDINDEIKKQIESIIQDDFYNDVGLLSCLHDCSYAGTEAECQNDIIEQLKDELPMTGSVYEDTNGFKADFEIDKDDLWKIYYIQNRKTDKQVPNLENVLNRKEFQREPEQLSFLKEDMKADWFQSWIKNNDDDEPYYDQEDEDWLYIWRVIHGKCELDDGTYGAFTIKEPYYGWEGFDKEMFDEACKSAAYRISQCLLKDSIKKHSLKNEEKADTEIDKQISEVLRIAK